VGENVEWIYLDKNRAQWRDLVNAKELPDFIKGGEFLDQLSDYQISKNDYSQWR
jgi:hypothetical protein